MKPTFNNKPNELITTTDGRKLYHSRSVAVVGVIYTVLPDDVYFIIEKRGTAPGLDKQGLWCLPCGYLDWNESGPDAICRELWEEVGVNLKELRPQLDLHLTQPWFVKTEPDENRQNVTLRYAFELDSKVTLIPNNDCEPNEVADAKWITASEIKDYQFAFNHDTILAGFAQSICRAVHGVVG